ncbi:MAG TPA: ATP-binding protein [Pyrinomonadaceae bacterium]|nr:ATP-binding protein [Pyrinomonadaceae bacterium]
MSLNNFISETLCHPTDYISYSVSEKLARMFPGRAVVEGESCQFNLDEYARAGLCSLVGEGSVHAQYATSWRGRGRSLERRAENAWFNVLWRGRMLDVLYVTWTESGFRTRFHWIVADTRETAEEFFGAVSEWCTEVRGEILVFEDGHFDKSKEIYDSIRGASFDGLILPERLSRELQDDLPRFFASREMYERYRVPWKRGVLLIGPPGNGKTHAVKAMVNRLGLPCLYVKSLESCRGEHTGIRTVFERARHTQPCVVVLEDIDSLVNDKNRSFFLNELDGFASNTGVAVLATTNHPERLDSSILDRPSRFDRKFYFELPAEAERLRYAARWNESLEPTMRLSAAELDGVARSTEGFSFAYLKELFLSTLMQWVGGDPGAPLAGIVAERAARLREQMSAAPPEPAAADD